MFWNNVNEWPQQVNPTSHATENLGETCDHVDQPPRFETNTQNGNYDYYNRQTDNVFQKIYNRNDNNYAQSITASNHNSTHQEPIVNPSTTFHTTPYITTEANYAEANYAEANYAEANYAEANYAEANFAEANFSELNHAEAPVVNIPSKDNGDPKEEKQEYTQPALNTTERQVFGLDEPKQYTQNYYSKTYQQSFGNESQCSVQFSQNQEDSYNFGTRNLQQEALSYQNTYTVSTKVEYMDPTSEFLLKDEKYEIVPQNPSKEHPEDNQSNQEYEPTKKLMTKPSCDSEFVSEITANKTKGLHNRDPQNEYRQSFNTYANFPTYESKLDENQQLNKSLTINIKKENTFNNEINSIDVKKDSVQITEDVKISHPYNESILSQNTPDRTFSFLHAPLENYSTQLQEDKNKTDELSENYNVVHEFTHRPSKSQRTPPVERASLQEKISDKFTESKTEPWYSGNNDENEISINQYTDAYTYKRQMSISDKCEVTDHPSYPTDLPTQQHQFDSVDSKYKGDTAENLHIKNKSVLDYSREHTKCRICYEESSCYVCACQQNKSPLGAIFNPAADGTSGLFSKLQRNTIDSKMNSYSLERINNTNSSVEAESDYENISNQKSVMNILKYDDHKVNSMLREMFDSIENFKESSCKITATDEVKMYHTVNKVYIYFDELLKNTLAFYQTKEFNQIRNLRMCVKTIYSLVLSLYHANVQLRTFNSSLSDRDAQISVLTEHIKTQDLSFNSAVNKLVESMVDAYKDQLNDDQNNNRKLLRGIFFEFSSFINNEIYKLAQPLQDVIKQLTFIQKNTQETMATLHQYGKPKQLAVTCQDLINKLSEISSKALELSKQNNENERISKEYELACRKLTRYNEALKKDYLKNQIAYKTLTAEFKKVEELNSIYWEDLKRQEILKKNLEEKNQECAQLLNENQILHNSVTNHIEELKKLKLAMSALEQKLSNQQADIDVYNAQIEDLKTNIKDAAFTSSGANLLYMTEAFVYGEEFQNLILDKLYLKSQLATMQNELEFYKDELTTTENKLSQKYNVKLTKQSNKIFEILPQTDSAAGTTEDLHHQSQNEIDSNQSVISELKLELSKVKEEAEAAKQKENEFRILFSHMAAKWDAAYLRSPGIVQEIDAEIPLVRDEYF